MDRTNNKLNPGQIDGRRVLSSLCHRPCILGFHLNRERRPENWFFTLKYDKHLVKVKTNLKDILSQTAKNVQLSQPMMFTAVLVTPRTIVELWQFSTVTALKQGRKVITSKIIESQSLVLENYTSLKKTSARNQTMRLVQEILSCQSKNKTFLRIIALASED